jgi:hypothetical protein
MCILKKGEKRERRTAYWTLGDLDFEALSGGHVVRLLVFLFISLCTLYMDDYGV